jgi:hypothetical protein
MGNAICLPGSTEDQGVQKRAMMAVGVNTNEINDEALDLALGANVMSLKQKVSLRFKCTDLPNLDVGSKTDAFCILWQIDTRGRKTKLGATEMVADNLNPEFVTEIVVDYFFEVQQKL